MVVGVVCAWGWGGVSGAIAVGYRARNRLMGELYMWCIVWFGGFPSFGESALLGALKAIEDLCLYL